MIQIIKENNLIVISGDQIDLLALSKHIEVIANSDIVGKHIHLDESNFFDKANCELIVENNEFLDRLS